MEFPADRGYHQEHLWAKESGPGTAVIGITDFAQDQLGKIIFADLPGEGDSLEAGEEMGALESVKSVSDLVAPVNGEVVKINDALDEEPAVINQDCYGEGWLVEVKLAGPLAEAGLMSAEEYQAGLEG